jgi:hypothetical protein
VTEAKQSACLLHGATALAAELSAFTVLYLYARAEKRRYFL